MVVILVTWGVSKSWASVLKTVAYGTSSLYLAFCRYHNPGAAVRPICIQTLTQGPSAAGGCNTRFAYRLMFILEWIGQIFIIDPRSSASRWFIMLRRVQSHDGQLDERHCVQTSQGLTIVMVVVVVAALFGFVRTRAGKSGAPTLITKTCAAVCHQPERVVAMLPRCTIAEPLYGLRQGIRRSPTSS
jgi:hypothetical protein